MKFLSDTDADRISAARIINSPYNRKALPSQQSLLISEY